MEYNVTVATGTFKYSGTVHKVSITLVGENGESERKQLDEHGWGLCKGQVCEYKVRSSIPLGRVFLVRLEMKNSENLPIKGSWFCSYVKVTPSGGEETQTFPSKRLCDEILPQELTHRNAQLQQRQETFRWQAWAPGIPKCVDFKSENDLPPDVRFDFEDAKDFNQMFKETLKELSLEELILLVNVSWKDLNDLDNLFCELPKTSTSEYIREHWEEDVFFGYQFMNGPNPRMIQRCRKLPSNFAVQGEMVQNFLHPNTTLDKELEAGNIYLVDYAILDGIPGNVINGKQQYIAAPLCLLYEHPNIGLIPIAIQLVQNPTKDTPIFFPNDQHDTWLLAKMWVRHAEFQTFEVLSHLLRTHLIAEVFCVATWRQLPAVHPIYKLLIPHLKYTLEINCRARTGLISSDGIFKKAVSTGGEGLLMLVQREYKILTYRSLQPSYDFRNRDVSKLNKYFYRDHSLKLWNAIEKFVSSIVSLYYTSDHEVKQDSELQAWIKDVVEKGLTNASNFGLPNKLQNKQELITLLSVIIFTCSAQHAAVNNGQFDFCSWVFNTPCTMRQPPPTDKDGVTRELIMSTLPDIHQSCFEVAITYLLVQLLTYPMPLGNYREQHFTEPSPQKMIEDFKQNLNHIEKEIEKDIDTVKPQYLYLCPKHIDNSIAI
ncbi:polyunsaturated fatty acid lipoxygenase ALOX15B-like [Clarias gariepinus]